jgi:hypothetical protein
MNTGGASMKSTKTFGKSLTPSKKIVIRTTFLDLVSRLADLAKDDAALIASVRRILEGCNVRLIENMAPVRVAESGKLSARKARATKSRPAWA